jgi:hypothetical protein
LVFDAQQAFDLALRAQALPVAMISNEVSMVSAGMRNGRQAANGNLGNCYPGYNRHHCGSDSSAAMKPATGSATEVVRVKPHRVQR